jgi:hypothetical protein
MRRVSPERVRRRLPAAWITRAKALVAQLAGASVLQRARIIKKNAPLWSEIKEALWAAGGEKCWYSEVLLPMGEVEVEHFRPKGRLNGEKFPGYWWLAFNWNNYRIASHLANTRRYDRVNSGFRGKGGYFPLVGGVRGAFVPAPPANDPLCIRCEMPLLLDPVNATDVRLITFDQDGLPGPHPIHCSTQPGIDRVRLSIAFYSLDDGILSARRADVWKQVLEWSDEMEQLVSAGEAAVLSEQEQQRQETLTNLIADAIDQSAEFSSVAIAALQVRGNRGWNTALLGAVA